MSIEKSKRNNKNNKIYSKGIRKNKNFFLTERTMISALEEYPMLEAVLCKILMNLSEQNNSELLAECFKYAYAGEEHYRDDFFHSNSSNGEKCSTRF